MKVRLLAVTFGFFLATGTAYAGPTPGGPDSDGDTVENAFDNCISVSNANQNDTDHNGCGDACTQDTQCDFTGGPGNAPDGSVGTPDFLLLGMNFGMAVSTGTNGDCAGAPITNGPDGQVGAPDFLKMGMNFGHHTGPSGITTAQCKRTSCQCVPQ